MNEASDKRAARTRAAILDALASVIMEEGALGFSVQQVADRAGVTHRTVYNHFPTRKALNDAFGAYVEELLNTRMQPPDAVLDAERLPGMLRMLTSNLGEFEGHLRATVMLNVASRAPAKVTSDRTLRVQREVVEPLHPMSPATARAVTAALRMFASTAGWHLLTEHYGLSEEDAVAAAEWATKAMLSAARSGELPKVEG